MCLMSCSNSTNRIQSVNICAWEHTALSGVARASESERGSGRFITKKLFILKWIDSIVDRTALLTYWAYEVDSYSII